MEFYDCNHQLKLETDPERRTCTPASMCSGSVSPSSTMPIAASDWLTDRVRDRQSPVAHSGLGYRSSTNGETPSTEGLVLTDPQTCLISIERVHCHTSEATGAKTSTVHAGKAVIEHSWLWGLPCRVGFTRARNVLMKTVRELFRVGNGPRVLTPWHRTGCIPIPESTS